MVCDPIYCVPSARVAEPGRKKTGNDQQATIYAKDGARFGYITYAV